MNTSSSAPDPLGRRDFLKASATLVGGAAIAARLPISASAAQHRRSMGANDRIRIGIIGCGNRGRTAHMEGIHNHVAAANFEIVAVCDPWRLHREQANGMVRKWFGRDARQFTSYRDLLAMDGLDAVMISSPDHLHTTHLEAAANAGKHIYVEKPLATEMDKLVRSVDAVKRAGTVVQVGTQLRSQPAIVGAREVMRSGLLGKISKIEENRNRVRPYWYQYLGRGVKEADVDWKEFLGDRPMRPFNPDMYEAWYGFYEFSQGPVVQYGPHFLDTAHFIMDATFPESCVCTGGTFTWKDEHRFTAPDCVSATWIYPEGFMLSSSNNLGNSMGSRRQFYGSKGTLDLNDGPGGSYSAEGGPRRDGGIRGKVPVAAVDRPDHYLDWLQCMRTGKTPHAPIDAGYLHAVAVLMAVRSFETGRKAFYDVARRLIHTAA